MTSIVDSNSCRFSTTPEKLSHGHSEVYWFGMVRQRTTLQTGFTNIEARAGTE